MKLSDPEHLSVPFYFILFPIYFIYFQAKVPADHNPVAQGISFQKGIYRFCPKIILTFTWIGTIGFFEFQQHNVDIELESLSGAGLGVLIR